MRDRVFVIWLDIVFHRYSHGDVYLVQEVKRLGKRVFELRIRNRVFFSLSLLLTRLLAPGELNLVLVVIDPGLNVLAS